ncbi:hypothetical protein GCM10007884_41610 [Methylobacterium brachythecii]|uniref:Secreted protein n=1 Tax=Methylobacterium brachythecii TaxID=1176177 RepID=A0ABQ6D942_9HYPH|nr:hypothetical protein GCM10007884_41610 [Methylobacterium brachythecii]
MRSLEPAVVVVWRVALVDITIHSGRPAGGIENTGDGRSPGSRVDAPAAFPDGSGGQWQKLAAYSCGGSSGIDILSDLSPHSLFTPLPGHRRDRF